MAKIKTHQHIDAVFIINQIERMCTFVQTELSFFDEISTNCCSASVLSEFEVTSLVLQICKNSDQHTQASTGIYITD